MISIGKYKSLVSAQSTLTTTDEVAVTQEVAFKL